MQTMPAIFLSHGAPTLAVQDSPARRFLGGFAEALPKPQAIVVISAHHDQPETTITAHPQPQTIYDFRGFPQVLYEIQYPAPGAPELAAQIADRLTAAGIPTQLDPQRGLDHGAWVPLSLLYPEAQIPVLQLSMDSQRGADYHLRLGEALGPLREQGVLIIGSGSMTHDLGEFFRGGYEHDSPAPDWVVDFGEWVAERIVAGDRESLRHYRKLAPHAQRNHPTEEHFLPLFVALGAALPEEPITRVHQSHTYGILAMDVYAVGHSQNTNDKVEPCEYRSPSPSPVRSTG